MPDGFWRDLGGVLMRVAGHGLDGMRGGLAQSMHLCFAVVRFLRISLLTWCNHCAIYWLSEHYAD